MTKSPAADIRRDLEATLDDVARLLRQAAESVSGDAEAAIGKAAGEVAHAAERLRKSAMATARDVAGGAAKEIKDHPLAALTAAITAAAALVGVIAATHRKSA